MDYDRPFHCHLNRKRSCYLNKVLCGENSKTCRGLLFETFSFRHAISLHRVVTGQDRSNIAQVRHRPDGYPERLLFSLTAFRLISARIVAVMCRWTHWGSMTSRLLKITEDQESILLQATSLDDGATYISEKCPAFYPISCECRIADCTASQLRAVLQLASGRCSITTLRFTQLFEGL